MSGKLTGMRFKIRGSRYEVQVSHLNPLNDP